MRRKEKHIVEVLVGAPWWVSMVLAIVFFVFLRWIAPAAFGVGVGNILGNLSVQFSTWISLFFIVLAIASGVRDFQAHRGSVNRASTRSVEPTFGHQYKGTGKKASSVNPLLADEAVNAKPMVWSIELLRDLEWKRFEAVVAMLFRELGFRVEVLESGADGGIDAKLYRQGEVTPAAIVQCKSWKSRQVGIKPLREFLGVMTHEGTTEGIFLAAFDFTQEAMDFAKANRIDAVDGKRFMRMIETLSEGAQQRLLRMATEGDYKTPSCPSCAIKLVQRSSSHGGFWGCTNYPRCKYKMNVA